MNTRYNHSLIVFLLSFIIIVSGCASNSRQGADIPDSISAADISLKDIEPYSGEAYIKVNGNQPFFTQNEYSTTSFELYSPLDELGRCGTAYANIGTDIMPDDERGEIGMIKPAGWNTKRYEGIDGGYLYNRCHLIGYQLSGENANERNLITGTRYLNIDGMLPFENKVSNYVRSTENHVLYRVTPLYDGNNLLANGVLIEALSMEDSGAGIRFNVFCYNVQPNIEIDYATGESHIPETKNNFVSGSNENRQAQEISVSVSETNKEVTYIGNKNSRKFHYPACDSVGSMKDHNKQLFYGDREEAIEQGFAPCARCRP